MVTLQWENHYYNPNKQLIQNKQFKNVETILIGKQKLSLLKQHNLNSVKIKSLEPKVIILKPYLII